MNYFEIITAIVGSGILVVILKLSFQSGKIVNKIDTLEKEFFQFKNEFVDFKKEVRGEFVEFRKEVKEEFKEVKESIGLLKDRVLTIEVQLRSGPYHWEPRILEKKEE